MNAILEELRPIAKTVKILSVPNLPYKGDAVDFFAKSGTVEELRNSTTHVVEHLGHDRIRVTLSIELSETRGNVVFLFENLRSSRGNLDCDLTITPPFSPVSLENHKTLRRINLKSSSAIKSLASSLKESFNSGVNWSQIVSIAVSLAAEARIDSERGSAIDLAKVTDQQPDKWLVEGLIPKNANTIFFGTGESLKTISVHHLALSVATGINWLGHKVVQPSKVLVLDYENSEVQWSAYQQRILDGLPQNVPLPEGQLLYLHGNGIALMDQIEKVIRQIEQSNIGLMIVDSAAAACGNDPSEADAALSYFRAIQRCNEFGVTVITLAHVTKNARSNEGRKYETRQPLGSTYWHTSARATYFVESEGQTQQHYKVNFKNRKMNIGPPPPFFSLDINFEDPDGAITVDHGNFIEFEYD